MHRVTRPDAPPEFTEHATRWRDQYLERRGSGNAQLVWSVVNGTSARELALTVLRNMTRDHCSYCDGYPVFHGETIDHFRPKSKWPELAFDWPNLYLCCAQCQKRGDRFDEGMLRPDGDDYAFARYFDYEPATGRLSPAADASPTDQGRAEVTIQLFNLNHPSLAMLRKDEWHRRRETDLSSAPFRFLPRRIEPPRPTSSNASS